MKRNTNRLRRVLVDRGNNPRGGLPFFIDVKGVEMEKDMETERDNH
jgi:hypothetical protein